MNYKVSQAVILMAEDNDADFRLTEEAILESKLTNKVHRAKDGIELMAFLRKQSPFEYAPTPNIILLDLNMPRMDGREALKEIKSDPALKLIPVVILTTSDAEVDVLKTYSLNANCYIRKPVDFDRFIDVVKSIENFWFSIVTLPKT